MFYSGYRVFAEKCRYLTVQCKLKTALIDGVLGWSMFCLGACHVNGCSFGTRAPSSWLKHLRGSLRHRHRFTWKSIKMECFSNNRMKFDGPNGWTSRSPTFTQIPTATRMSLSSYWDHCEICERWIEKQLQGYYHCRQKNKKCTPSLSEAMKNKFAEPFQLSSMHLRYALNPTVVDPPKFHLSDHLQFILLLFFLKFSYSILKMRKKKWPRK